jgi:tight adherence protein C
MKIEAWLPAGTTPEAAITGIAALAVFSCVLAVWHALLGETPLGARAKQLKRRRDELREEMATPRGHAIRRVSTMTLMKQVTQKLNLLRSETTGRLALQLARAGWRSREALITFGFMKAVLPLLGAAGGFVLFDLVGIAKLPPALSNFAPLVGAAVGLYAPDLFVKNAIHRREKLLQRAFPDGLDLMVVCAEAGLSLDASMTRVAAEMERGCPEFADEFGLTAVELGFLPERRHAIDNLTRRCQLASVRAVANTLYQTEKYGTPLANALRVLAAEFRNERLMKAEEKAARLPTILTVPMILFIMPTLMIVLAGPAVLKIMDSLKGF